MKMTLMQVSILILLDYLLLLAVDAIKRSNLPKGLNPYFIGLSTLITTLFESFGIYCPGLNPYFIGLSTLITPQSPFQNGAT